MNDPDDLDELLAALRGPAQPGELVGEDETVNAMSTTFLAAASAPSKGSLTMFSSRKVLSSRRSRVAALVAVGVVSIGGVAAAAGSGGLSIPSPDRTITTPTDAPDDDPVTPVVDDSNDVNDDPVTPVVDDSNDVNDDQVQEVDDSNDVNDDQVQEVEDDSHEVNDDQVQEVEDDSNEVNDDQVQNLEEKAISDDGDHSGAEIENDHQDDSTADDGGDLASNNDD